jgi:hypothetical protein
MAVLMHLSGCAECLAAEIQYALVIIMMPVSGKGGLRKGELVK